jgi:hypothetical protein
MTPIIDYSNIFIEQKKLLRFKDFSESGCSLLFSAIYNFGIVERLCTPTEDVTVGVQNLETYLMTSNARGNWNSIEDWSDFCCVVECVCICCLFRI